MNFYAFTSAYPCRPVRSAVCFLFHDPHSLPGSDVRPVRRSATPMCADCGPERSFRAPHQRDFAYKTYSPMYRNPNSCRAFLSSSPQRYVMYRAPMRLHALRAADSSSQNECSWNSPSARPYASFSMIRTRCPVRTSAPCGDRPRLCARTVVRSVRSARPIKGILRTKRIRRCIGIRILAGPFFLLLRRGMSCTAPPCVCMR